MAKLHIFKGVDEFAVDDDDDILIEKRGTCTRRRLLLRAVKMRRIWGTLPGAAPAGVCPFS
jgi:hypothetical protein